MSLRVLFKIVTIITAFLVVTSCQLFEKTSNTKVVAKVHEVSLYDDDLKNFNIPRGLSEKDSEKYKDLSATRRAFKRFNTEDIKELSKIKLSFIDSDFNLKGKWISLESFLEKIPSLRFFKKEKILKDDYFLSYKSDDNRFFIKFEKIIKKGESAPIAHVEERIKQIILNKRKIKLKKQLEQEIRKDALQTKEYQIFE